MDREDIIKAMAQQGILDKDMSQGPVGVVIQRQSRRPACVVVRADGEDFAATVPGFFVSSKMKISRAEVEAAAGRERRYKEFLKKEAELEKEKGLPD